MPDAWEVLGVAPGTAWPEVRTRWLELVRELHPDHHGDPGSASRLAEVNAAYDDVRRTAGAGLAESPSLGVDDFRPVVFEAVVVASADLGPITDWEEPFSLEVFVEGPPTGYCRVELVPEAGGSVLTIDSEQADTAFVREVLAMGLARQGFGVTRLS